MKTLHEKIKALTKRVKILEIKAAIQTSLPSETERLWEKLRKESARQKAQRRKTLKKESESILEAIAREALEATEEGNHGTVKTEDPTKKKGYRP